MRNGSTEVGRRSRLERSRAGRTELIMRAQAGDREAWNLLHPMYWKSLKTEALMLVRAYLSGAVSDGHRIAEEALALVDEE